MLIVSFVLHPRILVLFQPITLNFCDDVLSFFLEESEYFPLWEWDGRYLKIPTTEYVFLPPIFGSWEKFLRIDDVVMRTIELDD